MYIGIVLVIHFLTKSSTFGYLGRVFLSLSYKVLNLYLGKHVFR